MIIAETYWSSAEEKIITTVQNVFDALTKGLAFQYLPDSIHIYPNYEKVIKNNHPLKQ